MSEEKRRHDRVSQRLPVTMYDGKRFLNEFVHDVSEEGMMIQSSYSCPVGSVLHMAIQAHAPIKATGRVVWNKRDHSTYRLGVKLVPLKPNSALVWGHLLNRSWEVHIPDVDEMQDVG
ncbi:MAG: PilZ domain-containing protein [Pseudomonadota bacterium]